MGVLGTEEGGAGFGREVPDTQAVPLPLSLGSAQAPSLGRSMSLGPHCHQYHQHCAPLFISIMLLMLIADRTLFLSINICSKQPTFTYRN